MRKVKKALLAICLGLTLAMTAPAVLPAHASTVATVQAKKKKTQKVKIAVGQKQGMYVFGNGKIRSVKSSKKKVAKVKKKGKKKFWIIGKKKGKATVSVKLTNGRTLKCKVYVRDFTISLQNNTAGDQYARYTINSCQYTKQYFSYNNTFSSKLTINVTRTYSKYNSSYNHIDYKLYTSNGTYVKDGFASGDSNSLTSYLNDLPANQNYVIVFNN